jgi:Tol biopolymer transport system component/DNA-binding winged helix-turn-helix (wHTH) protein
VLEFETTGLGFHMDNDDHSGQIVRFGLFEANLQTGELRKSGVKVPLQDQPFQVCAILLSRSGELVTREELRQKVWPEDTFVDFDHALNTAITKIRLALGDEADNPRFVQTLPRRGYRFIAPVDKPSLPAPPPAPQERGTERVTPELRWLLVWATLLVLLSGIGIWRFARNRADALPPLEVAPLAGQPGVQIDPAFSRDGNQVAFVLRGAEKCGIYTTMVGGEKSLRLTSDWDDASPTWSPDGRRVAFYRYGNGMAIYVVPAFGGSEHRLYAGPYNPWARGLDWSPDGNVLAFSGGQANKNGTWISLLSIVDSSIRQLTSPSGQEVDYSPAFSPDGSTVAFVRGILAGAVEDLYVVPAVGGIPQRLTFDRTWIRGSPAWTPDGREIVFSSERGGLASLWRVSASGGTPRPVAGVGVIASGPSISAKGNQLAYMHSFIKENILRLDLKDEKHSQGPPVTLNLKKGRNWRPNFSPDGKRFAFESVSGYAEIWVCDSGGSDCRQLTSLQGTAGVPRWSPDGSYMAFEFRPKERSEIYLLEVGGGMPRLLPTLPGADNGGPSWSRDGKWIYFYSDRGGEPFQLWKVSLMGGPPVQVTKNGGVYAAESADGRFLYYSKYETPGIWKVPLSGGEEKRVLDQAGEHEWYNWALARNGVYFLEHRENGGALDFFDFTTGKTTTISTLEKQPGIGLAVSADGKSILYTEIELEDSNIMLVKNFR